MVKVCVWPQIGRKTCVMPQQGYFWEAGLLGSRREGVGRLLSDQKTVSLRLVLDSSSNGPRLVLDR